MKLTIKRTIVWFIIIFALVSTTSTHAYANDEARQVLVINSYHPGFVWTDMQTTEIVRQLNDSLDSLVISLEYLDWKQYPTQENLDLQKEMMLQKYKQRDIDIIITTDDAALQFAITNRYELFGDIPIVFSGVMKDSAIRIIGDTPNVTGVYESPDVENTINQMSILRPRMKNVYIINDNSESGIAAGTAAIHYLKQYYPSIQIVDLTGKTLTDIQQSLFFANPDDAALITVFLHEPNNVSHDPNYFSSRIAETSTIPIFGTYDFVFGHGITGGSLLSGTKQGFESSQIAIAYLRGISIEMLPIVDKQSAYFAYDQHYLKKFDLAEDLLPKGTIIINKPFRFFEQYKTLVIVFSSLLLFLIAFIVVLFLNIRDRIHAQKALLKQNQELSMLYESLSASEEELRVANDDLFTRQQMLEQSESRFRMLAESANDLFWDWDVQSDVLHLEQKTLQWFGGMADHVTTMKDWINLIFPEDVALFQHQIDAYFLGEIPRFTCEFRVIRTNHQLSWLLTNGKATTDEKGLPIKMVGTLTEITEMKKSRTQIEHLAYHDTLTHLPNRLMMRQISDNMMQDCKADEILVLFFIDLDNFRYVNNNFGHQVGDDVLTSLSGRFQSLEASAAKGIFGRFGGDEFVFVGCFDDAKDIRDFSLALRNIFQLPLAVDENIIYLTSSIGYATAPEDGRTYEELLTHADMAMYMTKQEGKNSITRYEAHMEKEHDIREALIQDLRHGLSNSEFILFYQPQVDVEMGFIHGFEALIRWDNPRLGRVSPDKFIPIAETSGLIISLGEWIIREACLFAVRVNKVSKRPLTISVNLSMVQLMQADFSETVSKIFQETSVEPSLIEFEITESVLAESFVSIVEQLNNLRTLGSAISLDDFGTGFSSLTYLKALPILTLKIDKSFIDDIAVNYKNHIFIETIITLGQKMGLRLVAEGVEDYQQLNYLKSCGCHLYQGYLYSKPVPEEDAIIQASSSY